MMQKSQDKTKVRGGFTLAELLVVVAILGILFGMTFVGVVTYRKNLRLMEMNETAKEIYIAAQNQLTYANVNGTLEDLQKDSLKQRGGSDNIYCLYNTQNTTNNDTWKQVLLPFGSVDESVRNGSWIIEMNTDTWSIEGVFYSGSEDNIAHGSEVLDLAAGMQNSADDLLSKLHEVVQKGDKAKQKNFSFGSQSSTIFGYYGKDQGTASIVDPVDPTKENTNWKAPVLSVTNGNTLWLNIDIPMTYDELSKSGARLLLKVGGMDSGKTVALTLSPETINASKTYVLDGQSSEGSSISSKRFYIDKENQTGQAAYHILLDDITSNKEGNNHFAALFGELTPGENLKISATMTSTKMLAGAVYSNTIQTNSLFADANEGTVQIANFRHLENLDSGISGFRAAAEKAVTPAAAKAEQTADLDWTSFTANCASSVDFSTAPESAGGVGSSFAITGTDGSAKGSNTYVPVTPNAALTYAGLNHKISNVACSTKQSAGLFGTVSKNLTVQDLYLNNVTISSSETGSAGSLIGSVTGETTTVTNVLVTSDFDKLRANQAVDKKDGKWLSKVTSDGSSGGLIGSIDGGEVTVANTASTAVVQGAQYAGGLVGHVAAGAKAGFLNSYVGGHTIVNKYGSLAYDYDKNDPTKANISVTGQNGYAGGFLGYSENDVNVTACYSTASVASKHVKKADSFANMGSQKINQTLEGQSYYGSGDVNGNPWEEYDLVGAPIAEEKAVPEHPFLKLATDGKSVTNSSHVVSVKALGGKVSDAPWYIQQHVGDWTDLVDKEEIYTVIFHDHADKEGEDNLFEGRDSDKSEQKVKAGDAVQVIPELQTRDTREIVLWYWSTKESDENGNPIYGVYDCTKKDSSADKREYFVTGNPAEISNLTKAEKYTDFDPKKENKLTQVLSDLDVYPVYRTEGQYAIFESVHDTGTKDSAGNAVIQQNLVARNKIDDSGNVQVPAYQTIPGYQFTGWSTTVDGKSPISSITWGNTISNARETLGAGLTAYAQYDRIKTYQVRIQFRYIPSDGTFSSINDGSAVYWDLVYTREATQPFKDTISIPDELKENYYNLETTKIYRLDSNGNIETDVDGQISPVEGVIQDKGVLDFSSQNINSDANYVVVFQGANKQVSYSIQYQLRNSRGTATVKTKEEDGSKYIDTTNLTYADYSAASEGSPEQGVVTVSDDDLKADKNSVVTITPLAIPGFHVVGSYPQYQTIRENNQTFTITYERDTAWLFYDLAGGTYTAEDGTIKANIAPTQIISGQTIDANPMSTTANPQIAEPTTSVRNGCWLPRSTTNEQEEQSVTEWYDISDTEIPDGYKSYTYPLFGGIFSEEYRYFDGSWKKKEYNWYYGYYWENVTKIPDRAQNPVSDIQCVYENGKWQWKKYGTHTVLALVEHYQYDQPIWRFYTEEDYNKAKTAMEDAKKEAKNIGTEVNDNDYNILTYLDNLEKIGEISRINLNNNAFNADTGNCYAVLDWQKPEKAKVKVELFVQDVDDDPKIDNDSEKKYYYFSTLDGPECNVGEKPSFQEFEEDFKAQNIVNKYNNSNDYSIFKHLTLSTTRYDMNTVQPDGSTIVRLYYNRKLIQINFYYGTWIKDIYGNYTQFTQNAFEKYSGLYQSQFINSEIWKNYKWLHVETNTVLTFLTKFDYDDFETINLYQWVSGSNDVTINHYLEDPKKTNINHRGEYKTEPSQTTLTSPTTFTFSNKYLGYTLLGYEIYKSTGNPDNSEFIDRGYIHEGDKADLDKNETLNIYYLRNTQKIMLNNAVVDADKANADNASQPVVSPENGTPYQQVLYQDKVTKLPGQDAVTRPAGVSSEAIFAGWATSSSSDAEPVTNADGNLKSPIVMQYYDLQYFAKWVMPDVSVTLHNTQGPDRDVTALNTVQKYSMYTPPTNFDNSDNVLKAPEGYTFDGWYTDSSCTTPYVDTQITGNTDLYARWKQTAGSWTYTVQGVDADTGEQIQGFPEVKTSVDISGTSVSAPTSKEYPDNDVLKGYYPVVASMTVTPTEDQIADETKRIIRFAYRKTDSWSYSVAYHLAGAEEDGIGSSVIRVPQDSADQKYLAVTASEETTVFTPAVDFLHVNNDNQATLLYVTGMQKSSEGSTKGDMQSVGYLVLNRKEDQNCRIDVNCSLDFSSYVKDIQKLYDGKAAPVDTDLEKLLEGSDLTVETAYQDRDGKPLPSAPVNAGEYTATVTVKLNGQPVWTSAKLKDNIYRRTVILQSVSGSQGWTVKTDGEGSDGFASGEGASYAFQSGSVFTYTLNKNTKKENYSIIRRFASQSS